MRYRLTHADDKPAGPLDGEIVDELPEGYEVQSTGSATGSVMTEDIPRTAYWIGDAER